MKRNELGHKIEEIIETEEYSFLLYSTIDKLQKAKGSYEEITVAEVLREVFATANNK